MHRCLWFPRDIRSKRADMVPDRMEEGALAAPGGRLLWRSNRLISLSVTCYIVRRRTQSPPTRLYFGVLAAVVQESGRLLQGRPRGRLGLNIRARRRGNGHGRRRTHRRETRPRIHGGNCVRPQGQTTSVDCQRRRCHAGRTPEKRRTHRSAAHHKNHRPGGRIAPGGCGYCYRDLSRAR